jgi:ribosomal protein S20
MDRADAVLFEGEAARGWLDQLAKRAEGTLDAAKKNKVVQTEFKTECQELTKAVAALERATSALDVILKAVHRREKL